MYFVTYFVLAGLVGMALAIAAGFLLVDVIREQWLRRRGGGSSPRRPRRPRPSSTHPGRTSRPIMHSVSRP